jgi:hypothetical protein
MAKFLNVLLEERDEREAVGFFGNWAKWSEEQEEKVKYDWRYENNIISSKKPIEIDGDYSQWRTNSVLCNHKDLIYFVNEINIHHNITDQMHYNYLYNTIRKQKRWYKAETKEEKKAREKKEELITLVSQYYKYNTIRAKEILKLLTPEQIEKIKKGKEKGGVK